MMCNAVAWEIGNAYNGRGGLIIRTASGDVISASRCITMPHFAMVLMLSQRRAFKVLMNDSTHIVIEV